MRAFLNLLFKAPSTTAPQDRVHTLTFYSALSFMTLLLIVTIPHRLF